MSNNPDKENPMNDLENARLRTAERSIKALEHRVIQLEEQMAVCLRWMRKQAELEVERRRVIYVPKLDDEPS